MEKSTRKIRKMLVWGMFGVAISVSTINCGARPPRLWQCPCVVRCVDNPNLKQNVSQYACGYTQTEVQRHARSLSQSKGLAGCGRVSTVCTDCRISRQHYCRNRVRTAGVVIEDDFLWEPIDVSVEVVTSTEFVDPDDPQYQDNQGHYVDPDPGNPDPGDPDPGGSDPGGDDP